MNNEHLMSLIEIAKRNPRSISGNDIHRIETELDIPRIRKHILETYYGPHLPTRRSLVEDLEVVSENTICADSSYANETIAYALIHMLYHSFCVRDIP